jgi:hypothetical protein
MKLLCHLVNISIFSALYGFSKKRRIDTAYQLF